MDIAGIIIKQRMVDPLIEYSLIVLFIVLR